jgi:tetratricopeptide (TPR) repeat protein
MSDQNFFVGEVSGRNAIGIVVGDVTVIESQPLSPITGIPQNIPRGTAAFVGREKALGQLEQQLRQSERVVISAVAGMGGIGKTKLAQQYAQQQYSQQKYGGGVCWLQASTQDVGVQILQYAQVYLGLNLPDDLDLVERVQACWQRWQPPTGEVLIVVDDVADYGQVQPYLPTDPRFKVLLTTRNQSLARNLSVLSLDLFSPAEALALLQALIGPERLGAEPREAEALVEWLGYLPLAVELVGCYLAKRRDCSIATVQERLEAKRLEARALQKRDDGLTTQHESVAAAFELSWEQLEESAQGLGCALSLFASAPVRWEWVESLLSDTDSENLEDWRDEQLVQLSLLEWVEWGIYRLHPLIREFFQSKQGEGEALKREFCRVMVGLAQEIPDTTTLEIIRTVSWSVPHLEMAGINFEDSFKDKDLHWLFTGLGRFYQGQGLYGQAEPWYQRCLRVTTERLGQEHPSVTTSLNNLAGLYYYQGRYGEAKSLYLQALEQSKQLLGAEHPNVATSLNNLAELYRSQGHYWKAEPLYLQALELRKQLLGQEHSDVAQSLNNLAELYRSQGRYEKAEPLYLQALELWKQLLGAEHPNVATSLNNLAFLYYSQGRYGEAEILYLQALELKEQLLGAEHPSVANSLNNLALLYNSQGRYGEAEPLYLQALELRKQLLGAEHPDVANSLNNLAGLYYYQGRYGEAKSLYLQALELKEQLLGAEHPDVATSLNNLARLYYSQGRYGEAEPLIVQALQIREQVLEHRYRSEAHGIQEIKGSSKQESDITQRS